MEKHDFLFPETYFNKMYYVMDHVELTKNLPPQILCNSAIWLNACL